MPLAVQKMSNLDYSFLVEELQPLVGGFVNKIFELRPNLFRFKVRGDKEYNLIIELGLRAHLSKYIEESPEMPSSFVMQLRKHLENAKITEIKQENDDRLLVFTFQKVDEYHIIFEMFAKGNLILTSADYTIISPYKAEQTGKRAIKRLESYIALPNPNRLPERPKKQPTIYYSDDRPIGFASFASSKFENAKEKAFTTISEMADEYYFEISKQKDVIAAEAQASEQTTSGTAQKLENTLKQQQQAMKKMEIDYGVNQSAGNYVYSNFDLINNVIRFAKKMLEEGKKEKEICAEIERQFKLKSHFNNGKLTIEPPSPDGDLPKETA